MSTPCQPNLKIRFKSNFSKIALYLFLDQHRRKPARGSPMLRKSDQEVSTQIKAEIAVIDDNIENIKRNGASEKKPTTEDLAKRQINSRKRAASNKDASYEDVPKVHENSKAKSSIVKQMKLEIKEDKVKNENSLLDKSNAKIAELNSELEAKDRLIQELLNAHRNEVQR